jgi:transposase-like protein
VRIVAESLNPISAVAPRYGRQASPFLAWRQQRQRRMLGCGLGSTRAAGLEQLPSWSWSIERLAVAMHAE